MNQVCRLLNLALAASLAAACGGSGSEVTGSRPGADGEELQRPIFSESAVDSGLDFLHFNGMSDEHYYAEMMGGGVALFDYDNDGDLDVYLTQGHMLGFGKTLEDARFPPKYSLPLTDRLYRNDLEMGADGRPRLRFSDVTESSQIQAHGYGMGVMAGDVDNDGWVDLYLTNFGPNQMLRNRGDGTFEDVSEASSTDDPRWSVAAAFFDYDRDGFLDLFLGNYVAYTLNTHQVCLERSGAVTYCGPLSEAPEPDRLFHNRGDGTFEDTTARLLNANCGATLGVVTGDYNLDGWLDLYVTLDAYPNQLWMNQQDGSFRDEALVAGAAVNMHGGPEGSMGVAAGDIDADGDEDLIMTHIDHESNTVYINDGSGYFQDMTNQTGLGIPSWEVTGFGVNWIDYDNDGWLDAIVVNGAVYDLEEQVRIGDPFPLHQPNQLYRNLGNGGFQEVSALGGEFFELSEVSRGSAFGDLDNDGDTDVVVFNNNGPVRLLVNNVGQRRHWLGLRLRHASLARDMLGTWVGVFRDDAAALWRRSRRDGSYGSANDPRVLFGLGADPEVEKIRVWWPDGQVEEWERPLVDRYLTLVQGTGRELATRF